MTRLRPSSNTRPAELRRVAGCAAAAAFLERAANLTVDRARRVERLLAAAQINVQAGAYDEVLALLAGAESGSLSEFARARVDLLRGQVACASGAGRQAPAQLLKAANRLEPLDVALARGTYLDAWGAALFAGRLADEGGSVLEVSRAARAAPQPSHPPTPAGLLLDGLATLVTDGLAAAAAKLKRAVSAFRGEEVSADQSRQWGILASSAAVAVWDFESWDALSTRQVELARDAGALGPLSIALNGHGMIATWSGGFEAAAALAAEDEALKEATGTRVSPYGAMLLAAYQGRPAEAFTLIEATIADAVACGEGLGVTLAHWTTAVLDNGLGRYADALAAAEDASEATAGLYISDWALPELIEAAVRSGKPMLARDALQRLAETTTVVGDADWAAGIEARSQALLSEGVIAERLYLEAIDRLYRTRLRPELARAHLLYGEWLRRENRTVDAREQLRAAYDAFAAMGADGFADRTRKELLATGETVSKRRAQTHDGLTPQEEHIAKLARDGRTNTEIGAELYLSGRTVEWHLRKVFTKLGISSRKGLHDALPSRDRGSHTRIRTGTVDHS